MKPRRACELCRGEAALHCESDSAFLCWACDARVHAANFLVARHARRLLCLECGAADPARRPISGPGFLPVRSLCRSCNDTEKGDDDVGGGSTDSESESSSCCSSSLRSSTPSSCISSAESGAAACVRAGGSAIASVGPIKAACSDASVAAGSSGCLNRRLTSRRRRRGAAARRDLDARTEDLLLNWCRRVGLDDARAPGAASHALGVGMRRMTGAPFRVVVAAAVWFAANLCCPEAAEGGRRWMALLRRLEACSGVPAKLIAVAEAKLSQAIRRRRTDEGEGWAECSS